MELKEKRIDVPKNMPFKQETGTMEMKGCCSMKIIPNPPSKHFQVDFVGKQPVDEVRPKSSRVFFSFMSHFVSICRRQSALYVRDIHPPSRKHLPKTTATRIAEVWNKRVLCGKQPNLILSTISASKSSFLIVFFILIPLIGVQLGFPVIVNTLSQALSTQENNSTGVQSFQDYLKSLKQIFQSNSSQVAWILAGVVSLQIMNLFLESILWYVLYDVLVRMVVGSLDIMVNKMLTLSDIVRQNSASSNLTNLLFSDTMRIANMLQYLYYYITLPITFVINAAYLGTAIGPIALSGFIAVILFIPLFYYIIVGFSSTLVSLMSLTDSRVRAVTEVLNGIKVIKLFTMESIQQQRIMNVRKQEMRSLRKFLLSMSIFSILGASSAPLMTVFAFIFMWIYDTENFTAQRAYSSIYMFKQLGLCFVFLPGLISFCMEASISAARIKAFLLLPTFSDGIVRWLGGNDLCEDPLPLTETTELGVDRNSASSIGNPIAIQTYYQPSFCYGLIEDGIVPPLLDSSYDYCQKQKRVLIRNRKKLIATQKKELANLLKTQSITVDEHNLMKNIVKTAQSYGAGDKDVVTVVDGWSSLLELPLCSTGTKISNYFASLYKLENQKSQYHRTLCASLHAITSELLQPIAMKEIQYTKDLAKAKKDTKRTQTILLDRFRTLQNGSDAPISLHKLSLTIKKGELVGIYGPVGSGKTTLFAALLGELRLSRDSYLEHEKENNSTCEQAGLLLYDYDLITKSQELNRLQFSPRVKIFGKVAYFMQSSTIFSGTVRDNILFYSPYDEQRYRTVCDVCCLIPDLLLLKYGDLTEIGEKGVSLSGGQKARVAFARALYSDAEILFLDDPLSAVDTHVGQQLWKNAIMGYLRDQNRTVLISSHQTQYFLDCDRLIEMSDGKIILNETMQSILKKDVSEYPPFLVNTSSFSQLLDHGSRTTSLLGLTSITSKDLLTRPSVLKLTTDAQNLSLHSPEVLERAFHREMPDVEQNAAEEVVPGSLSCKMYGKWLKSGTRWRFLIYLIIPFTWQVAYQGQFILVNAWTTNNSEGIKYIFGYIGLVLFSTIFSWATSSGIIPFLLHSCRTIFMNLTKSLMQSPMSFYDTTPMGRILNRLSKDMASVDMMLYNFLAQLMNGTFEFLGLIVTIGILAWPTVIIIIPIIIAYTLAYGNFRRVAPQLKRLEGITKSPIFNLCNEVLTSLQCIRAYQVSANFLSTNRMNIEVYSSAYYMHLSLIRWFIMRLNIISVIFAILIITALILITPLNIFGNFSALIISYCFSVQLTVSWCITVAGMFEAEMTSVERVLQYTELPSENLAEKKCSRIEELAQKDTPWPRASHSGIHVSNLRMRYRPELDLTLKGCDFEIKPGEHVGVVGRTGAGKSSLTSAFFRLAESEPGSNITIDGVNILMDISLQDARKAFAIIPQEPFLFSGTLRQCLCTYSAMIAEGMKPPPGVEKIPDEKLWRVLEQVRMREYFEKQPGGLDAKIAANGDNLSAGQRQLVCVARAFVREAKCVVLDEATAQVDRENDRLIQEAIRENLANTTVFSIAHRLDTIIDFDRILVVDAGHIAEYDTPANLLRKEDSIFSHLVAKTGEETAQELREMAFKAEALRQGKYSQRA